MTRKKALTHLALYLVLGVFALAGCALKPAQQQPEARIITQEGKPQLYLWPNRNSHSNDEASLYLVVRAGSLQEEDHERGYAHFVEHMAFNGTETFPGEALQNRLNELGFDLGAHSNAYTTFNHTLYKVNLNTVNPDRLEAAMELLAQWAYHIEFDATEVDMERAVILEEWRQSRPAPGRVSEQLEQSYYAGSRFLNRLPIGTQAGIESATADSLRRFYEGWYHPENMAIIVAGDVDAKAVQNTFDTHFPAKTLKADRKFPDHHQISPDTIPNFQAATDSFVATGYVDLTYFAQVPDVKSEQNLVTNLAMEAALDIWHQRAEAQLVATEGDINWIDYDWNYLETDFIQVRLSAQVNNGQFQSGFTLLEQERLKLITQGITQTELDDWVTGKLEHERSQQDSAGHLANEALQHYLTQWPMVGQQRWIRLLNDQLPKLDSAAVQSALMQVTAAQPKVRVVHAQNHQAPEQVDVNRWLNAVAESALVEQQSASSSEDLWPIEFSQPGEIISTLDHDNSVVEWTLDNGMTVLYRYSDQAPGKVYYALSGMGGLNALTDEETVIARLALPTLAASGLRHMNGPQLDQWLTSQAMEQQPYFGYFNRGMDGAGPTAQFPVMMRLLHISLTEGRVDPATWTHVRAQNEAHLEQFASHPHQAWSLTLEETLFKQDMALRALTQDELASITPVQMQSIYENYYSGTQNYRLAIVGDIDRSLVEQAITTSIGTIPAAESTSDLCPCKNYPSPSESSAQHVTGSGEQQATVVLRYAIGKSNLELDTEAHLAYLKKWLNNELMSEIREEQGLVYSLSVDLDGFTVFQDTYTLIVTASTEPNQVEQLVTEIESKLESLVDHPPMANSVEEWRRNFITDTTRHLNRASTQARALARAPLSGESIESALSTGENIATPSPGRLPELLTHFLSAEAVRTELAWLP